MSAAKARTALTANGIYLVYEHHSGRALFSRIEQVAHAAGADAHEHFHEIRAGDGEEGDARLAGYGLGQQSLTCARRAYKQTALGYACAHGGEPLGGAHELYHFSELLFFLLGAGHVRKGDLIPAVHVCTGAALAEVHYVIAAALGPGHKDIEQRQTAEEQYVGQQGLQYGGAGSGVQHEGEGIIRLGYVLGFLAGKLGGDLIHVILEDIHGRYIGVEVRLLREDVPAYLAVGVQAHELQLGDLRRLYPAVADVIYEFRIAYLFDLIAGKIEAGYQQNDYSQHYKIHYRCCKVSSLQIFTSPVCPPQSPMAKHTTYEFKLSI